MIDSDYFRTLNTSSVMENYPDVILGAPQMISHHKYPVEVHKVQSEDGYILEMHRIPHPGRPVIFLQHGLTCTSVAWIHMGPNNSLAYLLHDEGFDVWMGNSRGNVYSRTHILLNPDIDKEFWDFSWHEMAVIDLPAQIDYILLQTDQEQLYFVGHSMGNTMYLVLTSQRPEYNAKIKQSHAYAPVAFFNDESEAPFIITKKTFNMLQPILGDTLGLNEFPPYISILHRLARIVSKDGSKFQNLIVRGYYWLLGGDEGSQQLNKSSLPAIITQVASTTSLKSFTHYAQQIDTEKFSMFDYGSKEQNMIKYGREQPPEYDLSKVTTPTYLYFGNGDNLCHTRDVQRLCDKLPNCKEMYHIPIPGFNHGEFIWGRDTKELVHQKLISNIKQYQL